MRLEWRQEKKDMSNSTSKGTALVTGASRGIGAVYADRLAKRGYDLILVARSEAPLKALTASLASASGRRIIPIVADLNNKIDLAKAETKLREDSSITMLVNNAGIGAVVPLLNGDIEKMEDMVDAALVGLDQGELVTIPGLHDGDEWTRFEAARRAISQRFGNSVPASRYRIQARR